MRWLAVIGLLSAASVFADTVTLNDGSVVNGTVVDETPETVTVKLKFGQITYKRKEIKSIAKSGAEGAAGAVDAAELRDVLVLNNGQEQCGLLISENDKGIVFELIASGKNVSKTLMTQTTFAKNEVREVKRLTAAQRAAARDYLAKVAQSAREDILSEKSLKVEPAEWQGANGKKIPALKVELDGFTLETDTIEPFLRRCAVRLAKAFAAYKQLLGSASDKPVKIRVLIFRSMTEYYAAVGNQMQNPAFYAPDLKLISAGCDVEAMDGAVKQIEQRHAQLTKQLEDYKRQIQNARASMLAQVSKLYEQLNKSGKDTTAEGQAVMEQAKAQQLDKQLELARLEKLFNGIQDEIYQINRRNEQVFNQYTRTMFSTLYHEGFHAFADNLLFAQPLAESFPLWLNEGLAQYFECGRMEASRFILGQEDRDKMMLLRQWRKEKSLLTLEQVLNGTHDDYLVKDEKNDEHSARHYLQAWLMTNSLGEHVRLTRENLCAYVSALAAKKTPAEALPILSGMPNTQLAAALDEKLKFSFERQPQLLPEPGHAHK